MGVFYPVPFSILETEMKASPTHKHARMARERRTLRAMVELYCHNLHGTKSAICAECADLLNYALERLARCPYQEAKPTCAKCPIHCYKPKMRARVRAVMRYAGPRMLWRHPILALLHLADGLRRAPRRPSG